MNGSRLAMPEPGDGRGREASSPDCLPLILPGSEALPGTVITKVFRAGKQGPTFTEPRISTWLSS